MATAMARGFISAGKSIYKRLVYYITLALPTGLVRAEKIIASATTESSTNLQRMKVCNLIQQEVGI